MLRKLMKLTGLLVLIVILVTTLAFTSHEGKNIACSNIEVDFKSDDIIRLSQNDILRMVKSVDSKIVGKSLNEINSEEIELEVEKNKTIEKAEVFKVLVKDSTSYKGILTVKVKHRKPVVRIVTTDGSYYLDKKGNRFPVSIKYTADVLAVTGKISEKRAVEELLPFVQYLEDDDFWKAQIQQIHVQADGDVILTPLIGDQLIELGSFENYEKKLRNMRAFYEQVLAKNNWDKYKSVSVKYENQVIAKKR